MSAFVPPMLATPGRVEDVRGDEWVHEFKWDGIRAIAAVTADGVRLWSRNGNDVTVAYPDLSLDDLPVGTVLDAEIVALDDGGAPSFSLLQHRMHVRSDHRARQAAALAPANLIVFDLLRHGDDDLMPLPQDERREHLLAAEVTGAGVAVPPQGDDPDVVLSIAAQRGLEGLVAKRRDAPYRPGERSTAWRKVRLVREQDLVVVGWRRGRGGRSATIGALLLASWEDGDLVVAGSVGSGLKDRDLVWWSDNLRPVTSAPVVDPPTDDDLVWCEPAHVVRVRFREWTPEGRLRQPTYRGRRDDVDVTATSREA